MLPFTTTTTIRCRAAALARGTTIAAALIAVVGCSARSARIEVFSGRIYYVDGAGGGGALVNWGRGVRKGIQDAGIDAEYREFVWQTGLGAAADQQASNAYKRCAARRLAADIDGYQREHPQNPVAIIALSAGTAVAAYALEELPPDTTVANVVFLASSLSADYSMVKALSHVREHLYLYTSTRDGVLNGLVPLTGTADRRYCRTDIAGLRGFRVPHAAEEDRSEYDKIVPVPWREAFAAHGNHGGHLGGVATPFVREYIAPVIIASPSEADTNTAIAGGLRSGSIVPGCLIPGGGRGRPCPSATVPICSGNAANEPTGLATRSRVRREQVIVARPVERSVASSAVAHNRSVGGQSRQC